MNIFIGSLPYTIKENDLKGFFEEYGEVSSAKIITDKFSGRSKGFGFIEMPDAAAGKKAIEELNGAELEGRTIVVNEANDKPEGGARKPSGGGGHSNYGQRREGGGGGYNSRGNSGGGNGGGRRSDY
jgi:RNA recognition motif-containing protein